MPIKNWSVVPGNNTSAPPFGAPESSTKIKDFNDLIRQVMADTRYLAASGTVASAATTDLGAVDETWLTVSGIATITSFGTVSAGIFKFVNFSGALTLTHNATSLVLLTGANRITTAGDCGLYVSLGGGNWKEYFYSGVDAAKFRASIGTSQGRDAVRSITATTALSATDYGAPIVYSGAASGTLTLPNPLDANFGSTITVLNISTQPCTLARYALEGIFALGRSDAASITLNAGESIVLFSDRNGWLQAADGLRPKILQVAHFDTSAFATGTTVIPLDDTIPQNTEGDQFMSVTIAPMFSTSMLMVEVSFFASTSVAAWLSAAVIRDTGANSIGATTTWVQNAASPTSVSFTVKVAAGSTVSTTFHARIGMHTAGTTTLNGQGGSRLFGGAAASSIRVTEIGA